MILHLDHHRPVWHGFRFCALEAGQGLFGAWCLRRRGGRIGTGGRAIHSFASEGAAVSAAGGIARRKARRGHALLPRQFEPRLWVP